MLKTHPVYNTPEYQRMVQEKKSLIKQVEAAHSNKRSWEEIEILFDRKTEICKPLFKDCAEIAVFARDCPILTVDEKLLIITAMINDVIEEMSYWGRGCGGDWIIKGLIYFKGKLKQADEAIDRLFDTIKEQIEEIDKEDEVRAIMSFRQLEAILVAEEEVKSSGE